MGGGPVPATPPAPPRGIGLDVECRACPPASSTVTAVGTSCFFCAAVLPGHDRPLLEVTDLSTAFADAFPSTPGHTLLVPRRHVSRVLELSDSEHADLWALARRQLVRLEHEFGPDAYTIGINDGVAAGQTLAHVHLHLMPRIHGDVPDPRGGLRWVVPPTADYWSVIPH